MFTILGFGKRRVEEAAGTQGQAEFTSSGTWTAPPGVTSVCVVAVGGGGGGMVYNTTSSSVSWAMNGGGGGGLAWYNNAAVTPGTTYNITVGTGGSRGFYSSGSTAGGASSVSFLPTSSFIANGGSPGRYNTTVSGGTYVGQGGGVGGASQNFQSSGRGSSGGGGAGGYSGNGGRGGNFDGNQQPTSGSGGGGAGGGQPSTQIFRYSGSGGGVGIYGEGSSGVANRTQPGAGGSGGTDGIFSTSTNSPGSVGGLYGGGGGGSPSRYWGNGGDGGGGAVRIIWGAGRAFPSTNTADVTPVGPPAAGEGYYGISNPELQWVMSAQNGSNIVANTAIDLSNSNTVVYTGNWIASSSSTATSYTNSASNTRYYYPLSAGATLKTVSNTSGNSDIISNGGFTYWITMIANHSGVSWSRPWNYWNIAAGSTNTSIGSGDQYDGPFFLYNISSNYIQYRRPTSNNVNGDYAYTSTFLESSTATITLVISQYDTGTAKYWLKRNGTVIASGSTFSFSAGGYPSSFGGYGIRTTDNSGIPVFADNIYSPSGYQVSFDGIMESGFANRPYTDAECLTLVNALDDDFRF